MSSLPALVAARLDVSTFLSHSVHMDVGVRRLKQHLSEYLEKAAGGAIIRITDRGRPKAVLGPVPGTLNLERGVAERWIRPGPASATSPRPARRHAASSSSTQVLREDRDR
jgi:prevent-host-death family protein